MAQAWLTVDWANVHAHIQSNQFDCEIVA